MTVNFDTLILMDELIRLKATGNAESFAEKLEISQATLFRYLNYMREFGAPIEYNRTRNSYQYKKKGKLSVHFCEGNFPINARILERYKAKSA